MRTTLATKFLSLMLVASVLAAPSLAFQNPMTSSATGVHNAGYLSEEDELQALPNRFIVR
jgi:hypothetical protein